MQSEKDQFHQQMNGVRSKEKLRSSAESQVTFNEAIRKVIEEKDRRIESLETSLKTRMADKAGAVEASQRSLTNSLIRKCFNADLFSQLSSNQSLIRTLEEQLAEVQRKNAQLDSELREANQKLSNQVNNALGGTTIRN